MLSLYIGVYTILLALLWGLFAVVKIHAYKFKNFSNNIVRVTNLLLFFLIFLSVLGYVLIFMSSTNTTVKIDNYSGFDTKKINY